MEPFRQLPFRLPDFTRISWTSDKARAAWEPRLQRIARAWSDMEWLAVAEGVRRCCLARMTPARFTASTNRWQARNVSALGLAREAADKSAYSSNASKSVPGEPYVLVVGLGRLPDLDRLKQAFEAHDDGAIGKLLGYPPCCTTFFRDVWTRGGFVDTTWPMAVNSIGPDQRGTCIDAHGPFAANILWRWVGVRAVPHLPCSFGCSATVDLAARLRDVGIAAGYRDETEWVEEILSWPIEWSALHGIAEIRTPILRVTARTDATSVKYVVRWNGDRYPGEGATALRFPYRSPTAHRERTRNAGAPRASPLQAQYDRLAWYWRDNGFVSKEAMDRAHLPIVELACATLGDRGGAVLDLGCGNGVLLKKIRDNAGSAVLPFGVDVDPARIRHAQDVHPEFAAHFRTADIFSSDEAWPADVEYRLVLLSVRRLLEVPVEQAARLRARLAGCTLVVYLYADSAQANSLDVLAERARLRLTSVNEGGCVALAVSD